MLPEPSKLAGPRQVSVESGVAVATALLGLIVIIGSLRVGIGWGADGPKSGFFPFYVGLAIVGGSVINLVQSFATDPRRLFAEWGQLGQVIKVVVPTAIYVVSIAWIGLYVASSLLIGGFMVWLGGYRLRYAAPLAVGLMILTYLTFEQWFLVPLPKGPLENLLSL